MADAHAPGAVDAAFLETLRIPLAWHGYDTGEVDGYLDDAVAQVAAKRPDEVRFRVVRQGYDMQAVDAVLDRLGQPSSDETGVDPNTN